MSKRREQFSALLLTFLAAGSPVIEIAESIRAVPRSSRNLR
jgi:hypothetical protein